jgi:hypothetical protein
MTQPPGTTADGVLEPHGTAAQPHPHQGSPAESDAASGQERIHWGRLLQRKLLIRVTVPTLIGLVQLVFAIVAIVNGHAPARMLLWSLPALLVGYLFGRSTKIAWDDEKAQIVLIRAQLLLTAAYIILRVAGHIALEKTLSGRMDLADLLLVLSFGLFFGRTVGLADQIRRALSSRSSRDPTEVAPT